MKAIKVRDLKAGMKFDQPVYIEGNNVLVPAEVTVKQKDIDRLLRWDIEEVYTEGSVMAETEEPQGTPAFPWLPMRDEKYAGIYRSAIGKVEAAFRDIVEGTYGGHEPIDAVVNEIVEALRQGKNEMIQLILLGESGARKLPASSVNCMILATVIGMAMRLTSHRLIQLATAALLHDVGMLQIRKDILEKVGKLTENEINQVRTHPVLSYRTISKELKYPEDIALIALQHHERWDGNGYPRRLKGEEILVGARILAVADSYEAMVRERPYRNSMIGYSAMKGILSDNGKHFDPAVLKAFLESMGIFPIGSIVQLNNSSVGRVSENHPEAPLRPRIELLIDEYGTRIQEREVVDLLEKKSLFIVKAIDPRIIKEGDGEGGQ